jgi:hypothetical protein
VEKFGSPKYVALIVYGPFVGSGSVHVAVVIVPTVLTGADVQRFTDAPPLSE